MPYTYRTIKPAGSNTQNTANSVTGFVKESNVVLVAALAKIMLPPNVGADLF
jgi:hypothetical protein